MIGLAIGALGRLGVGSIAKRIAGKALRFATKGRLIGAGGGAAAVRRIGGAALGATTALEVGRAVSRRTQQSPSRRPIYNDELGVMGSERIGRVYRRMNPMNVRALRRSVRRINSAEKLFRKVFTITKGQVNVRKTRRSS